MCSPLPPFMPVDALDPEARRARDRATERQRRSGEEAGRSFSPDAMKAAVRNRRTSQPVAPNGDAPDAGISDPVEARRRRLASQGRGMTVLGDLDAPDRAPPGPPLFLHLPKEDATPEQRRGFFARNRGMRVPDAPAPELTRSVFLPRGDGRPPLLVELDEPLPPKEAQVRVGQALRQTALAIEEGRRNAERRESVRVAGGPATPFFLGAALLGLGVGAGAAIEGQRRLNEGADLGDTIEGLNPFARGSDAPPEEDLAPPGFPAEPPELPEQPPQEAEPAQPLIEVYPEQRDQLIQVLEGPVPEPQRAQILVFLAVDDGLRELLTALRRAGGRGDEYTQRGLNMALRILYERIFPTVFPGLSQQALQGRFDHFAGANEFGNEEGQILSERVFRPEKPVSILGGQKIITRPDIQIRDRAGEFRIAINSGKVLKRRLPDVVGIKSERDQIEKLERLKNEDDVIFFIRKLRPGMDEIEFERDLENDLWKIIDQLPRSAFK